MTQRQKVITDFLFNVGNKLGVPTLFFVLVWFSLQWGAKNVLLPATERHIKFVDAAEGLMRESLRADNAQTVLLAKIEESQRATEQITRDAADESRRSNDMRTKEHDAIIKALHDMRGP